MKRSVPLVVPTVLLGIAGTAIALGWLSATGGIGALEILKLVNPGYVALLVSLTATNVFIRFLRWHFLLRRVDVKIPTRSSLSIYLASLAAIATPAYIGEVVRPVLVAQRFGAPIARTLPVLLVERGLDVFVLAVLGAITAGDPIIVAVMIGGCAALLGVLWSAARISEKLPITAPVVGRLTDRQVIVPATLLSFLAWLPAGALVTIAAAALAESVPLAAGAQIFSSATLLGGMSLMPAGIGTTGSAAILGVQASGIELGTAVSIVSVLRLATTGVTLSVGSLCLVAAIRRARTKKTADSIEHFDEIAEVYGDQLPPHIRDLLVTRKADLIHARLSQSDVPMVTGLDLGCGHGAYIEEFGRRGYRVIGVEPSRAVASARAGGATVVAGSGVQLPFADRSFDFVYAIGVLHHLSQEARRQTFGEVRRVLKPGGLLLVHETNPRNPLFRFYMGYVFPIVRRIDEGAEEWLDPERQQVPGMTAVSTDYVTFLPDFVPRWSLPLFLELERRLERSRWQGYAVHYLAVFRAGGGPMM